MQLAAQICLLILCKFAPENCGGGEDRSEFERESKGFELLKQGLDLCSSS